MFIAVKTVDHKTDAPKLNLIQQRIIPTVAQKLDVVLSKLIINNSLK